MADPRPKIRAMFQKHVNAVMKTAAAQYLPRLAAAAGARIGCAGSEA
jgi:hypothetical protein